MQDTTIGLDLAKNIFQALIITESGEVASSRPLRSAQVLTFFKRLGPCKWCCPKLVLSHLLKIYRLWLSLRRVHRDF
jgi:transposase